MTCARHLALVGAAIVLAAAILSARPARGEDIDALQRWLAAVHEHQPGRRDGAALRIGAWSNKDLDSLSPYLESLTRLLPDPGDPDAGAHLDLDRKAVESIRQLARAEAARGDVNRIMKRGALLHADIMMAGTARRDRINARQAAREIRSGEQVAVVGLDGEHEGFAVVPRHWSLARQLLDRVHPDPASDDFVRLWYRATTAYMLQRNQWGDAERHLRHARERLTPDAFIHLDSGCLYEALGSPRAQSMMSGAEGGGFRFSTRSTEEYLRLAEMHFKQATVLDPTLIEARVRLGRVLIARGLSSEAVEDLEAASIASSDPVVRYYAVLFLGQANDALARRDAARAAYQRAAALYPMSQVPHLALSLLAREAGDRETAQLALRQFFHAPTEERIRYDPWWVYFMGSGRHMRELVLKLWTTPVEQTS